MLAGVVPHDTGAIICRPASFGVDQLDGAFNTTAFLAVVGRSSKSVDCVIEQVDRAIWSMHGDSSTISEQLELSKVRAKLSERHSNVLSLVEQHWMLTDRAIEPGEVAEQMADELGNNARQKALQALDALANKRLVEMLTRSDHKRGKVVSFKPLKSWRCA